MKRQHSFLVRYRLQTEAAERIEVEHIQSGEKVLLTSLAAATAWIKARATGRPDGAPDRAAGGDAEGVTGGRAR